MEEEEHQKVNSIGDFIKELAEEANLTPTALSNKINSTLNNVKDIYKRSSIDSELLLSISKAVNKNAFAYYDDKEPIASFKKAELDEWTLKIENLNQKIEGLEKTIQLQEELLKEKDQTVLLQNKLIAELEEKLDQKKG